LHQGSTLAAGEGVTAQQAMEGLAFTLNKDKASKTVYEIDLDLLPDKPWNDPGALISDYFNYGFDEKTWRQYCQKQLQMRDENSLNAKISTYDVSTPATRTQPGTVPTHLGGASHLGAVTKTNAFMYQAPATRLVPGEGSPGIAMQPGMVGPDGAVVPPPPSGGILGGGGIGGASHLGASAGHLGAVVKTGAEGGEGSSEGGKGGKGGGMDSGKGGKGGMDMFSGKGDMYKGGKGDSWGKGKGDAWGGKGDMYKGGKGDSWGKGKGDSWGGKGDGGYGGKGDYGGKDGRPAPPPGGSGKGGRGEGGSSDVKRERGDEDRDDRRPRDSRDSRRDPERDSRRDQGRDNRRSPPREQQRDQGRDRDRDNRDYEAPRDSRRSYR